MRSLCQPLTKLSATTRKPNDAGGLGRFRLTDNSTYRSFWKHASFMPTPKSQKKNQNAGTPIAIYPSPHRIGF